MDDIHSPPRTIPSATDGSRSGGNKPRNVINSSSRLFDRGPLYHPLARRSTTTKPRATSPPRARVMRAYIYKAARDTAKRYGCRPPGVSRVWRWNVGRTGENSCEKLLRVSFSATTEAVIASSPFFRLVAPSPSSSFYLFEERGRGARRIWKMKKCVIPHFVDSIRDKIGGREKCSSRTKRRFNIVKLRDSFKIQCDSVLFWGNFQILERDWRIARWKRSC